MYSFWCSKKGIHHLYAVFLRWKMARGMRSVGQEKCDPVHPNTANRGGAHPSCWQRWTREGTRLGYLKVRCSAALSAASQSRVGRMLSGGASAVRSGMGYSGMPVDDNETLRADGKLIGDRECFLLKSLCSGWCEVVSYIIQICSDVVRSCEGLSSSEESCCVSSYCAPPHCQEMLLLQ